MQAPKTLSHGSTFGPFSRFQLIRHESHRGPEFSCFMVLDAERPDELTGTPGVIRQEQTIEAAVAGLELDDDPIAYHYDRMGDLDEARA